jgi:hypothetical protein
MWQDYVGLVPGVAAAVMGLITLATQKMRRWQKITIFILTIVAIGASGFSAWLSLHEKAAEASRRTAILERFGALIGDGQSIMNEINIDPNKLPQPPVPIDRATKWINDARTYVQTLGPYYVARLDSNAGIQDTVVGPDPERNKWWISVRDRVIRLHEFSSEFAGQVGKEAGTK